jgi:hypothetical protein
MYMWIQDRSVDEIAARAGQYLEGESGAEEFREYGWDLNGFPRPSGRGQTSSAHSQQDFSRRHGAYR